MLGRASIAVLAALAAACTYDWAVGPSPGTDGGVDSTAGDAPADVAREEAAPPSDVAMADAPEAPFSCAEAGVALAVDLAVAKANCVPTAMPCMATAKDECGCTKVVATNSAERVAYVNAVAAFLDAGCIPPSCPSTCPTAQLGLCIASGDGGLACSQ